METTRNAVLKQRTRNSIRWNINLFLFLHCRENEPFYGSFREGLESFCAEQKSWFPSSKRQSENLKAPTNLWNKRHLTDVAVKWNSFGMYYEWRRDQRQRNLGDVKSLCSLVGSMRWHLKDYLLALWSRLSFMGRVCCSFYRVYDPWIDFCRKVRTFVWIIDNWNWKTIV